MSETSIDPSYVQSRAKPRIPLTVRIFIGVALGIVAGITLIAVIHAGCPPPRVKEYLLMASAQYNRNKCSDFT